jgi:hypothetical protein
MIRLSGPLRCAMPPWWPRFGPAACSGAGCHGFIATPAPGLERAVQRQTGRPPSGLRRSICLGADNGACRPRRQDPITPHTATDRTADTGLA